MEITTPILGWKTHSNQVYTLASLSNYTFSYFKAHAFICKKIDQTIRGFWWGHTLDIRKIHLKKWDGICQAKSHGGLGIRKTEVMNKSLLGKQAWRILTDSNSLVVATILPKYCKNKSFMDIQPKKNDSWIWKSILIGRNVCSIGIDV